MDSCANTCARNTPGAYRVTPEVTQAAETLACLLTDVPEFQEYLRLARVVRLDGEVNRILQRINGYGFDGVPDDGNADKLATELESLPVMRAFRQAEQTTQEIFSAVEATISGAAGVSFAEHARPSACG